MKGPKVTPHSHIPPPSISISNPPCYCALTVLKLKLSHIPDQIEDRSQFLQIIRCVVWKMCMRVNFEECCVS